jgi:phospholipid transport system substrate-binding protein
MMMFRVFLAAVLGLPFFLAPVYAATPAAAEEVVRMTVDRVTERLVAQKRELKANPERIYELIHELVIPHFDFPSIARWVLGRTWREASPEQKEAFVGEFRTLLVRTYAKALLEYSEEPIRFLDTEQRPESNLVLVKTEVDQPSGQPIPIHYRLHISDGNWKVVDVTVDGVSLVSTYRGSFASEIQRHGLDGLIVRLTERNARLGLPGS